MSMPAPIPGLAGIEHVGITVPDLEAASRFLIDVIGGETLYDIGPLATPDDWMAAHLVRPLGARIHRLRVVKVANGPVLELIEPVAVDDGVPPRLDAVAIGFHIAFYVDDMEAALASLRVHGARIESGPVEMTEGPSAGLTWLYFRSPWGLAMELVSYPAGIAAYRHLQRQVWRPHRA
ncbi:MAG: VOC family protein [Hyphomicrobiaceae bacterium]|nr:VOC family protein [Hyphomicrobiaceae bacterium]